MALAMLALFAQLWMVQLSTVHWGQMLSEQALFSDVCSAQIATHSGQTPDTSPANHTGGGWLNCPVCSAAAASFTPPSRSRSSYSHGVGSGPAIVTIFSRPAA